MIVAGAGENGVTASAAADQIIGVESGGGLVAIGEIVEAAIVAPDSVVALSAVDRIGSFVAIADQSGLGVLDRIVIADNDVIAAAALDDVSAATADEQIVAAASVEQVRGVRHGRGRGRGSAAVELVIIFAAEQYVVGRAAGDEVFASAAFHAACPKCEFSAGEIRRGRGQAENIVSVVAEECCAGGTAGERVSAITAGESCSNPDERIDNDTVIALTEAVEIPAFVGNQHDRGDVADVILIFTRAKLVGDVPLLHAQGF